MEDRYIGTFEGEEKGPLLICIGGMHGNEPAGVRAMENVFQLLAMEPHINPSFFFKGRLVGLRGNLGALEKKVRYQEKDLNRQWFPAEVERVNGMSLGRLEAEDFELRDLNRVILQEIESYQPNELVFLDLHTTGATGGIFSIPAEDDGSLQLAIQLHAPVIIGMFENLKGTLLNYFSKAFEGISVRAVAFEAGQHTDELSENRTIAALINCMRTIGCVQAAHVENRHDQLLMEFSRGLPKVTQLVMRYGVKAADGFRMLPGFQNFQKITKGQKLATDRNGPVFSPGEGMILMPLYQAQGSDGFFIIRAVEP